MSGIGEITRPCWMCRRQPAQENPAAGAVCGECDATILKHYQDVWLQASLYLHRHWTEIVERGSFDLTKIFGGDAARGGARAPALSMHLHFVRVLAGQLYRQAIAVDLESFAASLRHGSAHPEVEVWVAGSGAQGGKLWSYDSEVSVLRDGSRVLSALWVQLEHPVALKLCYIRTGAALRPPLQTHPWHPDKQKKIVKISAYKGDVEPVVARRDLRI